MNCPRLVIIVPCSGAKADVELYGQLPAGELYSGTFHRYARHAAERLGAEVIILSAYHGLVTVDKLLGSYDFKMGDEGGLGDKPSIIAKQAAALGLLGPDVTVVAFTPNAYTAPLAAAIDGLVTPLAGSRGIGEQRGRIARFTFDGARPEQLTLSI